MVSSNNIGARLLRDDGGRRDMERNIKRCVSTGQGRKEEDCSSSEDTVVSSGGAGGDNRRLAVLGRQEPQELKVKASRLYLGKLIGLGGWTLQRREGQGSTQIT